MLRVLFVFCSVAAALFLCGCTNTLRVMESENPEFRRTPISSEYAVEYNSDITDQSLISFKVSKMQTSNIKQVQVKRTSEIFTPYSFKHKLYEVPAGFVVVPAGLMMHIMTVVSFGIIPYDAARAVTNWGAAAINPFMNAESEARVDERPISIVERMIEEHVEKTSVPAANISVNVYAGSVKKTFKTDANGEFKLYLLPYGENYLILNARSRNLKVFVGSSPTPQTDMRISRYLLSKLKNAETHITRYQLRPTGSDLVKCVKTLETLGFTRLAYELEMAELKKHEKNTAFQNDFDKEAAL